MDTSSSKLGAGDGQGGLLCCSPWGCKESDTTEQLNNSNSWGITAQSAGQICGGRTVPCYEVPKARGIPAPPPPSVISTKGTEPVPVGGPPLMLGLKP